MNKVIQEVEIDSIMERVKKAKKFSDRLEAREKEQKFKFSKSGCEKQFKFNIKMKKTARRNEYRAPHAECGPHQCTHVMVSRGSARGYNMWRRCSFADAAGVCHIC